MSIILEDLTKRLSGQAVVDRVSLTVEDGGSSCCSARRAAAELRAR
jgi:hypothetical protein